MGKHNPSAYRRGPSWCCKVKSGGVFYYLGSHPTRKRAALAGKLFKLWLRRGFKPDQAHFPLERGAPKKAVIATSISTGEEFHFSSVSDATTRGGFDRSAISKAARGVFKQHAGFTWRYDS